MELRNEMNAMKADEDTYAVRYDKDYPYREKAQIVKVWAFFWSSYMKDNGVGGEMVPICGNFKDGVERLNRDENIQFVGTKDECKKYIELMPGKIKGDAITDLFLRCRMY